jgi:asparagine synthase (glutamine-hydrolysing)
MCGITGVFAYNLVGKFSKIHIQAATQALHKRGPDHQNVYVSEWVCLGHRRLSIIDTRSIAHQPMWDTSGRYGIVFNGEIFNYQELRKKLTDQGVNFTSESDTEVLLHLCIRDREKALNQLNGFFSFCFYDSQEESLLLARDRYGIKPLLYLADENRFAFASEMKSLVHFGLEKNLDHESLYTYFQLNYCPAPKTIFSSVKKLSPGHYLKVTRGQVNTGVYYEIPRFHPSPSLPSYDGAKKRFKELLEASVQRRLVADVPLGSFLSGGIDSSVIATLAARHKPDLHTFSIGFRDEKFFDETTYAQLVAHRIKSNHTVFSLTNQDLFEHLDDILNYIDEPFADSSAIAVYILSKETRKHATVALSGDGADELLGGYNKHAAFYRLLHPGWKEKIVGALLPVWNLLPQSRNSFVGNRVRQLARFAKGMHLNAQERYWQWAAFANETEVDHLLRTEINQRVDRQKYLDHKNYLLDSLRNAEEMNDLLLTDLKLVLPNDMLTKVDWMSMANSLEVRVPFLDVELVNFVSGLPSDYKINATMRKRLLQDAYREDLPPELYNRPKKGFEVPLLKWFRTEMKSTILDDLLSQKLIEEQQLFHYPEIEKLKRQLFSSNPGDVHARIWALIVFQRWWKNYMR